MMPQRLKTYMCLFLVLSLLTLSCSQETDEFDVAVEGFINEKGEISGTSPTLNFAAVDDVFSISGLAASSKLNVLANDSIPTTGIEDYQIVAISTADNAEVIINEDKTITYAPHAEAASKADNQGMLTDDFTYTLEITTNGTIEQKQATVTVNASFDTAETDNSDAMGELLAFPGAEGYGKNTTGGRGGEIYHVTNLNDSGFGSFRYGLEEIQGPRTIVFDVGGYIDLETPVKIRYGNGNITIAGQTSPGNGITLRGAALWIHASNVIVRYIRVRPGFNAYNPSNLPPNHEDYEPDDGIKIQASHGKAFENVIIDHCSVSWSHDGLLDISSSSSTSFIKNVTISNTLLSENISKHFGVLINNSYNISFYRNIIAFTSDRNIAVSSPEGTGVEMVNNLVYGTDKAAWYRVGTVNDFIGNLYISGPRNRRYETFKMELSHVGADILESKVYLNDNIDDDKIADLNFNERAEPFITNVPNHSTNIKTVPSITLESELVGSSGASLKIDEIDHRIYNSINNRNGNIISNENEVGGYPEINYSSRLESYDSDSDGMADVWEISTFGSLANKGNDDFNGNGYTNLEEFLYFLTR